jgi:hypothetical protein
MSFLTLRQPARALQRINAIRRRLRLEPLDALPPEIRSTGLVIAALMTLRLDLA